jgi:DNA-binding Lrp family transcriptional regulator
MYPNQTLTILSTYSDISVKAKSVLNILCQRSRCVDGAWICWPAKRSIAENTGLSPSSVKRALRELRAEGIISREYYYHEDNGRQGSNRYTVTVDPALIEQTKMTNAEQILNDGIEYVINMRKALERKLAAAKELAAIRQKQSISRTPRAIQTAKAAFTFFSSKLNPGWGSAWPPLNS